MTKEHIIAERTKMALAAIKSSYGTEEGDYGATLFVSHHLEEINEQYWVKHLRAKTPQPQQILDLLILRSHWGEDEDGIDVFDFTLPENATDYVISVGFSETGEIEEISMES